MRIDEFQEAVRSFQTSRILLTALEMNVFTWIEGGATSEEAAARMQSDPRATRMLLDALASLEVILKRGEVYSNSELASAYLTDSAAGSMRAGLLHEANRWHTWSNLTGRVAGKTPTEEHRVLETGRHRALLAMLDRKAAARAPKLLEAIGIAGTRRILDIGGGSAAYSMAFVRAGEGVEAEILELPQVASITEEYVARGGLEGRVRTRACDYLTEELGSGFDLILLFSIMHLQGEEENRGLLGRCYGALNPGGRVAIHDHILEADRTRPRAGAIFALNMLLATRNGGTYSFEEYGEWLRMAGFEGVERRKLEGEPTEVLIASR